VAIRLEHFSLARCGGGRLLRHFFNPINYGRLCAHVDGLASEMIAHDVAVPYVSGMRHHDSVFLLVVFFLAVSGPGCNQADVETYGTYYLP
jgi:hypothetical protein